MLCLWSQWGQAYRRRSEGDGRGWREGHRGEACAHVPMQEVSPRFLSLPSIHSCFVPDANDQPTTTVSPTKETSRRRQKHMQSRTLSMRSATSARLGRSLWTLSSPGWRVMDRWRLLGTQPTLWSFRCSMRRRARGTRCHRRRIQNATPRSVHSVLV
jgi:hypothetical protein